MRQESVYRYRYLIKIPFLSDRSLRGTMLNNIKSASARRDVSRHCASVRDMRMIRHRYRIAKEYRIVARVCLAFMRCGVQ